MADRVAAFLREQGRPVSSAQLMERFLRAAPRSETDATRLLSATLEPAGLRYRVGEGWSPPPGAGSGTSAPARRVAAVWIPGAAGIALAACDGQEGGGVVRLEPATLASVDTVLVAIDPRRDGPAIRSWLRREGLPDLPIRPFRPALGAGLGLPRGAGLEAIAERLGIHWLEGDDPWQVAITMAACMERASALAEAASRKEIGGDPEAVAPQASRIPPEQLASLPASPGTYRFFDEEGSLLYVGKARDLRRRVLGYFRPGRRPGHGDRFLARAVRVEFRVEGSELEALLSEARLIARRAPEANVQRAVHERAAPYAAARAWALLLPSAGRSAVSVVMVREGRYLGHAPVGPRGGGLRQIERLLGKAMASRAPREGRRGPDRDTPILTSWLARHGDRVSRIDLDSFRGPAAAMTALEQAVRDVRLDPRRAIYRGVE